MTVSSAIEPQTRRRTSGDATPLSEIPADATVRRKRAWGWGILIALALATPVLLVVSAYVGLSWSGDGLAQEALAKARAAGEPTTDEEMDAFYESSPAIDEATGHWLRAIEFVSPLAFAQSTTGIPLMDAKRPPEASESLPPEDLAVTVAFLDRHRAAVDAAHAARRAGAVARFPLKFSDGSAMLLPHVQAIRDIVRLLELDLKANLAQGNVAGAVEDLLSIVAASESLSNEPVMVSQLVRNACFSIAVAELQHLLQRADLSEDQLVRLQEAFARQDFHQGLRRSFRGEQWFMVDTMNGDEPTGDPNLDRARMIPFRGADIARGMEFWRTIIDAGDEGMLEALEASHAAHQAVKQELDSPLDHLKYVMTASLIPSMKNAVTASISAQANARLAETAIACERYRLSRGAYPSKLENLVPEYLPEPPLDPFDERPLRYSVDEKEALLYSIGRNQIDDGGVDEATEGDVVFRLVRTK